jgi:hypothetical protein
MKADDATLTERKLGQHQREHEDRADQQGQEAAGKWWISACVLHGR